MRYGDFFSPRLQFPLKWNLATSSRVHSIRHKLVAGKIATLTYCRIHIYLQNSNLSHKFFQINLQNANSCSIFVLLNTWRYSWSFHWTKVNLSCHLWGCLSVTSCCEFIDAASWFFLCEHFEFSNYLLSGGRAFPRATSVCCPGREISFPWSIKCTSGILEMSENERCTSK